MYWDIKNRSWVAALTFSQFFSCPFHFIPSSFSFYFVLSLQSLMPGVCVARMPWWWFWKAFSPPACSILSALARRLNRCLPPVRVMMRYGTDHELQDKQSPQSYLVLLTSAFILGAGIFDPTLLIMNEWLMFFFFFAPCLLSFIINTVGTFG